MPPPVRGGGTVVALIAEVAAGAGPAAVTLVSQPMAVAV
jgi:hypothetical protein